MNQHIASALEIVPHNTAVDTLGALNNACGADFVKTLQRLPPSLASVLQPGQRGCSYDGDADRLIYYYMDERNMFRMLDGDKIAALVANFIVELAKGAGLEGKLEVGVVQTAYANGSSTKYLSDVRPHLFSTPWTLTNYTEVTSAMRQNWRQESSPCSRKVLYRCLF